MCIRDSLSTPKYWSIFPQKLSIFVNFPYITSNSTSLDHAPQSIEIGKLTHRTWSQPSRVLMDWIKKPVVTPQLGKQLLNELSLTMEVLIPTPCISI